MPVHVADPSPDNGAAAPTTGGWRTGELAEDAGADIGGIADTGAEAAAEVEAAGMS